MSKNTVEQRLARGLRAGAATMAVAAVQYDSRKLWDAVWDAMNQARELDSEASQKTGKAT